MSREKKETPSHRLRGGHVYPRIASEPAIAGGGSLSPDITTLDDLRGLSAGFKTACQQLFHASTGNGSNGLFALAKAVSRYIQSKLEPTFKLARALLRVCVRLSGSRPMHPSLSSGSI